MAAAVLAILVLAPGASAQSSSTQQYTPQLDQAGVIASGGVEGEDGSGGDPGGGSVAAEAGTGSGGKLPFTGYPLTPFVALAGLLLLAGLTARIVAPALDRRRG